MPFYFSWIQKFITRKKNMAQPGRHYRNTTRYSLGGGKPKKPASQTMANAEVQRRCERALNRHLTTSPRLAPLLFRPYKMINGFYDMPLVAVENQSERQHGNNVVSYDMTRISSDVWLDIRDYDKEHDKELEDRALATIPDEEKIAAMQQSPPPDLVRNNRGGGDEAYTCMTKFTIPTDHTFAERTTEELREDWPDDVDAEVKSRAYLTTFERVKRQLRKQESERVFRHLVENYSHMQGVREALDAAKALGKGDHVHDMADAFLLALQAAMDVWRQYAKELLGPRRPNEEPRRPDHPCLTNEQCHRGGTIRVLGIDPGTKNMGLCLLELTGMQTVPADKAPTSIISGNQWTRGDPEPCFRVLVLELVDLKSEWSTTQGQAVVSHHVSVPQLHLATPSCPDYMSTYPTIDHFFYPLSATRIAGAGGTRKRKRKSQREDDPLILDDAGVQPPKKKRSRLRKKVEALPATTTPIVIDLVREDEEVEDKK